MSTEQPTVLQVQPGNGKLNDTQPRQAGRPQGIPAPQAPPKVEMLLTLDPATGQVRVLGIPPNMEVAMTIMGAATKAVAEYFVRAAIDGKVTASQGPQSGRIIQPNFIPPRDILKGKADR